MILGLDHVQLAMPLGGEDQARGFYGGLLGMVEVAKPKALAGRGGAWFQSGAVQVHLGVEAAFVAATKAHPAFVVADLDGLADVLSGAGYPVIHDGLIPGRKRFYSHDPFGNRLEFTAVA